MPEVGFEQTTFALHQGTQKAFHLSVFLILKLSPQENSPGGRAVHMKHKMS